MSQCVICSDNFDNVERVTATPCGHVYHQKCVVEWLNVRNTCPECRSHTSREKLINLYFNPASIHPDSTLTNEVERLKTSLSQVKNDLAAEHKKFLNLRELQRVNEKNVLENCQKIMNLSNELSCTKTELAITKQDLRSAKTNLVIATNQLKLLVFFQRILSGSQAEADEMLKQYEVATNTKESFAAKRLAYCCSLTKRELEKVLADKSKLSAESVKLSQNLFLTTSQLNSANNKIKRLNQEIKDLKEASVTSNSFTKESFPNSDEPRPSTSTDSPFPNQPVLNMAATASIFQTPKIPDKSCKNVNVASPLHSSLIAKRQNEINDGDNALGGHHSVIQGTADRYARSKRKRKWKKF